MLPKLQSHLSFSVLLFFLLNIQLSFAAPASNAQDDSSVVQSQGSDGGPLAAPITVTSVTQQTTANGVVTTTCQITLTPIMVNGSNMVQEEKTCHDDPSNGDSNSTNSSDNSSTSDSSSATATSTGSESTSTDTSSDTSNTQTTADSNVASPSNVIVIGPSSTITGSAPQTTAPSQGSANAGSPPGVSVVGQSSIDASATGVAPPGTQAPTTVNAQTTTTNTGDTANPTGVAVVGQSSVPAAAVTAASDQSGAPTVAAAASASTDFTLPGKKLQVLPIGLGVFAGVSVIALIVVGWVTYERTKYRKRFRQQKLAEAGAPMGYGGMT